jgi:SAM-dependent methyltransferase
MTPNSFTAEWFSIFLDAIPPAQTDAEVAFIARQLPLVSHRSILDVCCGPGRHSIPLARRGYNVLGIDTNHAQISRAAAAAPPTASFRTHDMRQLHSLSETFDGVINLWASFGYFDDATNESILRHMAERLRPGGKAIIDMYNREHMITMPALEVAERGLVLVRTERSWSGKRLNVRLQYSTGAGDEYEWHIYTPAEFASLCAGVGLEPIVICAWFTESLPASVEHARMQFVLERR